ncbi:EamA family transporter [Baekduia soli]|uniref:EamA family transporter n=1 Tax=Baekduia soli TaxID=496014 RepID=A0A5B8U6G8_9ACTN|nr:EamA family transporter [Baekduia soli]QEC48495.1 EamA family transporter [Baekduia soli]
MTAKWLIPTVIYILALAGLGITSKYALRELKWHHLIFWSGVGYVVLVIGLLIFGQTSVQWTAGSGWAALGAAAVITALFMFFVALSTGEASKVVPISAGYPAVTVILAALFLSEGITVAKALGVVLVVGGVVVLTTAE